MSNEDKTNFQMNYMEAKLTNGRLVFLLVATLALIFLTSMNQFIYLFAFVPFPMALALAFYGRKKGGAVVLGVLALGSVFIQAFANQQMMTGHLIGLAISLAISWIVGEIILRKIEPKDALLKTGVVLIVLVFLGGSFYISQNRPLLQETVTSTITSFKNAYLSSKDASQHEIANQLMEDPQAIATQILNLAPAGMFAISYVWFWVSLFLVLRGTALLREMNLYPYSPRNLTKFKAPESMIWGVIVAVALLIMPESWLGPAAQVWGNNLIQVFGVFYFFQGFGIYIEFLNFLGIYGIFRSFLIVMTFVLGNTFLAYIGLFDLWVNFRKFFVKKENK